jgi:RNAse (barnase) inhibitor barstar
MKKAIDLCPEPKLKTFSYLSDRKYVSTWEYLNGRCNIPLTVIFKACNILAVDAWELLDGHKLYARDKNNFLTFKKDFGFEMEIIKNWVKLEGNLSLSSPEMKITQSNEGRDALISLQKSIDKTFDYEVATKLTSCKTRPSIDIFYIFSSPLRQILVLRHGIPLGYKSRKIKPETHPAILQEEETMRLVASDFETEGSFVCRKKTMHHTDYCEFSISTYSKQCSRNMYMRLKSMGFSPSFEEHRRIRKTTETEYKVIVRKYNDLVRLCFGVMPYLHHRKKIRDICMGLADKNYILKCRIRKSRRLSELLLKSKQKLGTYKKFAEYISSHAQTSKNIDTVREWVTGYCDVPIMVVWSACKLTGDDWKKHIPSYFSMLLWLNGLISEEDMKQIYNSADKRFDGQNVIETFVPARQEQDNALIFNCTD